MDTQTRYLWAFVSGFALLSGLFLWSVVYKTLNTFPVGEAPPIETTTAAPVQPPVRTQDPRLGSNRADAIEIVEYADYRCLHCRTMAPDLLAILSDPQMNVRLIWREAPTSDQTPEGLLPFAAARCAHAQGKFSALHPALFRLSVVNASSILDEAKAAGLNLPRFESCLGEATVFEAIKRDQAQALQYNIVAAPTLFIKGKPYVGALTRADLTALLR